jgi:hypothetical protein
MSIKYRIIRAVAGLLMKADPYILRELVVPEGSHIQRNGKRPRKKKSPVTGE